jgi:hypothetical protein
MLKKFLILFSLLFLSHLVKARNDSTWLIGINTAEVLKTLFRPGIFAIGFQSQYFYKNHHALYGGFNYQYSNERAFFYYNYPTKDHAFLTYIGINKFKPSKRIKWLSGRIGSNLGFYYNKATIQTNVQEPIYSTGRLYTVSQSYKTITLEGLFGYEFKLNNNLRLSTVGVIGFQKPFDFWILDRAPALGLVQGVAHIRFQAELWYTLK